jgi:BirA family biotin operon repressor/biotin-[acetyl-CoA-carboxylase] ligase
MEQDLTVKIYWLDCIKSTQLYLKDALKKENLITPVAVATLNQTDGVGSRGNSWVGVEGNLFFSFAIKRDSLPDDLKLESASIYFMYLLKEVLKKHGSKCWLKWPNDLYIDRDKIGGCITNIQGEDIICGIGVNIKKAPDGFKKIDIDFDSRELLDEYMNLIEKKISWKQIFSKYKLEFEDNISLIPHTSDNEVSFVDAQMMDDGSLVCNGQRIYSQR